MPVSFSEQFHISRQTIEQLGVFDVILDMDARVFIDPALLPLCQDPEFIGAKEKVEKYFSNIIILMRHAKSPHDIFWRRANQLLAFHEITGTCLGYSEQGTSGNAIGGILRNNILTTIKQLLDAGETDPVIFELLGVFQEDVGCDRISDLITYILQKEIQQYTQRMIEQCHLPYSTDATGKKICVNPYNHKNLLLLPQILLSSLPISILFDGIGYICMENQRVRDEINRYFDLGKRQTLEKAEIFELMKTSSSFRKALIGAYKSYPAKPYDFNIDQSGEYSWYYAAKEYVKKYPIDLSDVSSTHSDDALSVVKAICQQFKELVEYNGLSALLFDSTGKQKHESAAQLLFFGIAFSYCQANNLDPIREGNNGRGPVDFKLSRGAYDKALVEVKLSSNNQLIHGIEKQLPIYMQQERTLKAIYLVIDTGHPVALKHFIDFYNNLSSEQKAKIEYIIIDATLKKSASKA